MNVRRIVGLLVLALLIFFVITQPDAAANSVSNVGAVLRNAAESVTRFVSRVAQGL